MLINSLEKLLLALFLVINVYYDVCEIREDLREVPDLGYFAAVLGSGRIFRYISYLSAISNVFLVLRKFLSMSRINYNQIYLFH